jgi:hypothetical protein
LIKLKQEICIPALTTNIANENGSLEFFCRLLFSVIGPLKGLEIAEVLTEKSKRTGKIITQPAQFVTQC